MIAMNPRTRWFWAGFRVFLAVSLFFTTSLAGWGAQALAASSDNPGLPVTIVSESAILPSWFQSDGPAILASAAPPADETKAPLFDYDDGPVDEIIIRDRAGSGGTEVITYTVTADDSIVLWAAGYYSGTFVENQTVTWSVPGGIGEVSPTVGVSTTFFANTVGTGTVMATHNITGALTDATGNITVTAGALASIVIRDAAGGGGSEVGAHTMTADETLIVHAAGYDADDNYISDVSVTWATTGNLDAIPAGPSTSATFAPNTAVTSGTITADDGSSHTDASGTVTVNPGALHHFVVDAPASGTAGTGFNTTITAQDAENNTVISFSDTATLSTNGSDIQPTSAAFSNGLWNSAVTLTVAGSRIVTATFGVATGADSLTINPASLDHVVVTPGSVALDPGGTQQFSAQGYDAYDNAITGLGYSWAVVNGGGSISSGGLFTAATADALYANTVQATASGVNGTASVTINNVAPTADAGGPYSGDEGSAVAFFGSGSDANNDPLTYEWDFDYDGLTFNVDSTAQNPSHAYDDNGGYWAALRVTDDNIATSAIVTAVVTVDNIAPTALPGGPYSGNEGDSISFSGSQSDPGSADTFTYEWDFDYDGLTFNVDSAAQNPSHAYPDNDQYWAALRVTDDDSGVSAIVTATVTVGNVAPTALPGGPYSGDEGSAISLSGSQTDPGSADTFTYEWDLDYDGLTFNVDSTAQNPAPSYVEDGQYWVALRVTDDDSGVSGIVTAAVNVGNVAPSVEAGNNNNATEGAEVFFDGSFTDPGSQDTHTIEWNFGDGVTTTGTLTPTHIYADNGTYIVTLTVRDDDGGQGSDTLTVNVTNVAPNVLLGSDQSADEGQTVNLSGTFGDPGAGDTHTIEWDFGDGTSDSGSLSTSHVYTAAGSFLVTLTVTDDDGGQDSDTLTVNVANVPPTANISGPPTQTAGLDAVFDASGSTEPGQNITAYEWDLDDDGQYDDAAGVTATVSWTAAGVYTVGLRVRDAESSTDTDFAVITIEPGPLDHFVVSVPASSTAGVGFATIVTAQDQYDNVITGWDQDVTLSTTNGGIINPLVAQGGDFSNGIWSGSVSLTAAGDGRDVIASYDGHTGSDTLHIEPAAATDFDFSNIGDQTAGDASPSFSLTAYDPYGNQDTNYDGNHSLNWSGLMTSPNGTPPIYPASSPYFVDGLAYNLDFTTYNAETGVSLAVTASDGPGGSSNPFTVTHGSASTFVFSTIADQVAGSPGTIGTLTAEDNWGNTTTGYSGGHTLGWSGLGNSLNGDPADYPANPVNFAAGVAASLVFTPYRADTGIQLTATEGGVSGSSNSFNVSVGSVVGEIVIESLAGGAGVEIDTHDMAVYENLDLYAAGYDAWGNYIADQSVSWSGTGVALGYLNPLNGTSTTLTPVISGTGTVSAELSGSITDATGLITVRAPVLEVTLDDNPDPVDAGGTLLYTIYYSNTGNASATGVVLTLTLDSNLNYVSDSLGSSGFTNVRTWSLSTIGVEGSGRIIVTNTVASPLDNGTILTSVVEIDSDQTIPLSDSEGTTVQSVPVLHITKSDLQDPVQAGGSIIYNIEFSNTGNMNATGVVITDLIPANTEFESASHGGVYSSSLGIVTWNVGALAVGDTPYRTLEVQVDSPLPSGTVITNTGYQIDSLQTSPVTGADVTTDILSPTLTLSQTGQPDPVEAGELVTFTIDYSNAGDGVATQVVITDTVPEHALFVSASGGGSYANGEIVWNIGSVPGHQGGTVTVVFRVTSPLTDSTPILNYATIDSYEVAPATYLDLVYVNSEPDLHLSKAGAPNPVQAGSELVYIISYTNTGNANATGLIITDTLPAHSIFASASDGGTYDNGVVTWNLGLLEGRDLLGQDGVGYVTLVVTVASPLTDGTILENEAFISCLEGPTNSVQEQTEVDSRPVLHVDAADTPDPVNGGEMLVYTLFYSNTGNANATGVQLTVDYDSRLTFASAEPWPSSGNDTWNLPLLPGDGGFNTLVITLTTSALAPDAVLSSSFSLDSAETGPVSQVEQTQAQAVALALSASYDDNTPYPGKRITYTLNYTNSGDVSAAGVTLAAELPNGTAYVGSGWAHQGGGLYRYSLPGALGAGSTGSVEFIVQVNSTADDRLPLGLASLEADFAISDDGASGPELYTSDNQAASFVGIPDLVIDEIQVSPPLPTPNRPVTFTVLVRNQGTGIAGNPNVEGGGGFWVDLFVDPSPVPQSFPWNKDGDFFNFSIALAPGVTREIVFVIPAGLSDQYHEVYAKVDNYPPYPSMPSWQQNSLVPESDEENNVALAPVIMGEPDAFTIFLPVVLNNH